MKKIIAHILLLFSCIHALSQSPNKGLKEPEVGEPCPDVMFNKIDFYKTNKLKLSDLRGKWVVLDFWSTFCSGCIGSFPKISKEQREFGDSVQFIMVAMDSTTGERELYQSYHKKINLAMPSAFDSDLFTSFNVGTLPHTIIIDPKGIVRVITMVPNPDKLRALLKGENPTFTRASYANKKNTKGNVIYNSKIPFLVDGNGGVDNDFIFRSLLSLWKPGQPVTSIAPVFNSWQRLAYPSYERTELVGTTLSELYMVAYSGKSVIERDDSALFGKFSPIPIFEITDRSVISSDIATGKNLFSYSLIVPAAKATEKSIMQIMRNDLGNYFGYEVSIETRKMPYWRLIAKEESKNKLKTKGIIPKGYNNQKKWQELSLRNLPMKNFIELVQDYSHVSADASRTPLIDETGITYNIDIDLDWVKGDYEVCRKALLANGLDLVKSEKEMKVIIVRDPKTTSVN